MEPPFHGPVRVKMPGVDAVVYIRVASRTQIEMYNQPPPFDLRTYVGDYGNIWSIRRIKRGWLLSTFLFTNLVENEECECKTDNKFGDLIVQYTSQ
jgi:hypothetical protein